MNPFQTDQVPPSILAKRTLAQTKLFHIQAIDLRFSNGQERVYERIAPATRAAVMVLAIDGDDLLMIREYAVGTERYELFCVKGLIDEGETPIDAANRELQEEIGYAAHDIQPLRTVYTSPGYMFSPLHIFVARNLVESKLTGDEPEPLTIVRIPLSRLNELIDSPKLGNSSLLVALMLLQKQLAA